MKSSRSLLLAVSFCLAFSALAAAQPAAQPAAPPYAFVSATTITVEPKAVLEFESYVIG